MEIENVILKVDIYYVELLIFVIIIRKILYFRVLVKILFKKM